MPLPVTLTSVAAFVPGRVNAEEHRLAIMYAKERDGSRAADSRRMMIRSAPGSRRIRGRCCSRPGPADIKEVGGELDSPDPFDNTGKRPSTTAGRAPEK